MSETVQSVDEYRITLYEKIVAWKVDFEEKAMREGAAGKGELERYYTDAASGLAIALQEIDRERYDRGHARMTDTPKLPATDAELVRDLREGDLVDGNLSDSVRLLIAVRLTQLVAENQRLLRERDEARQAVEGKAE